MFYTHSNSPRAAFLGKPNIAFDRCKEQLALDNKGSPFVSCTSGSAPLTKQNHPFTGRGKWGGQRQACNSSAKAPQDTPRLFLGKPPFLQHTTEHKSYQKPFLQRSHTLPWFPATLPQPPPPSPAPQRHLSIAAATHCRGCFTASLKMKRNPGEMLLWALWKGRNTWW